MQFIEKIRGHGLSKSVHRLGRNAKGKSRRNIKKVGVWSATITENTKLSALLSVIVDRHHSLFGHISCPHQLHRPCSCQPVFSLVLLLQQFESTTGRQWKMWLQQIEEDKVMTVSASQVSCRDHLVVEITLTLSWSSTAVS